MELTKNEFEFLEVLWKAGRPLTRTEVIEYSVDKSWKDSSVHILINSLLKKGAIQEAGFVRSGKGFGRIFEPTVSANRYFDKLLKDIAKKTSPAKVFSALIEADAFDENSLKELEDLIREKIKD